MFKDKRFMFMMALGLVSVLALFFMNLNEKLYGQVTLNILTIGAGAQVTLDGQPLASSYGIGDHLAFTVPQGQHTVVVKDLDTGGTLTYALDLKDGRDELLLPVRPSQCFVRFDMTEVAYGGGAALRGRPPLLGSYDYSGAPHAISGTEFSVHAMPKKIKSGRRVHVTRDIPCSLMNKEDYHPQALGRDADDLYQHAAALHAP
jgi:hypothetical protein